MCKSDDKNVILDAYFKSASFERCSTPTGSLIPFSRRKRMSSGEFASTIPTPKDSYPLPKIDQLVKATADHKLLSFMDAYSEYNQIKMHPPDEDKTTFTTDQGIYCYKVGLKNAGATFQRMVNKVFNQGHYGPRCLRMPRIM